jgi:hypothetical protein
MRAGPGQNLPRRQLLIGLAIGTIVAICCSGCLTVPYKPGVPFENARERDELRAVLGTRISTGARVVHRVIVDIRGRELGLVGYIAITPNGDARLLASADMGGTAFELVVRRDGRASVLRDPMGLPQRYLTAGPSHDLAVMYLFQPPANAMLVRHDDNQVGLVSRTPEGLLCEFLFDEAKNHRLAAYREVQRGRLLYEMTFEDDAPFPNWPSPTPHTATVVHHGKHYSAQIHVFEMTPAVIDNKLFQSEDPHVSGKHAKPENTDTRR